MISQRAIDAIEVSDADELIRVIDGLCENSEWDELVELKSRCREAVTRGKQLWGVEEHIRYRLALEAPGSWAGAAVSEGVARFALGPLSEVAASTKSWQELEPYLDDGPWRASTAAERVIRGDRPGEKIPDLPNELMEWEPSYPLATYGASEVQAPSPAPIVVKAVELPGDVERVEDPQSVSALFDLVQPWVTESNGRYETSVVAGPGLSAIRGLGLTRARVGPMSAGEAMSWMTWAAASGGAHGRRRGSAAGRYGLWWTMATVCDLDWPADPAQLGEAIGRLRFFWFDDGSPGTGWELRIAIEDVANGLSWAIAAVDSAD